MPVVTKLNEAKRVHNVFVKHLNNRDKNLGPVSVDRIDVIKEVHRQLYDVAWVIGKEQFTAKNKWKHLMKIFEIPNT